MSTTPAPSPRALRIVIVGNRRDALCAAVEEHHYHLLASLPADAAAAARIAELQPDLIILDSSNALTHVAQGDARPIVIFTDDTSTASMDAAMQAGVSAYVVGPLQSARVRQVIDVALARFRQQQLVLAELSETRLKLAERKLIDRAKGLLMRSQRLTEDQAYQKLRTMAMNKNLKLGELAQRILDVEDLL